MKVRKRIRYGQNFFKDNKLVAELVSLANISSKDIVYEIDFLFATKINIW